MPSLVQHIRQHRKAKPAQNEKPRDGEQHQGVVHIGGEAVRGGEQVDPRVAKGADGVEHREVGTLGRPQPGHEVNCQEEGTGQFHPKGDQHKAQRVAHGTGKPWHAHGFVDQNAISQRDAPAGQHQKRCGKQHKAQSAQLDEEQDHHLPKQGVGRSGVNHH